LLGRFARHDLKLAGLVSLHVEATLLGIAKTYNLYEDGQRIDSRP
jgi:hypothetical protein